MKQRLGIAAALLGDPALLILDEPANGLDPQGVHEMRGLVGSLAHSGRTVLVSSHDLSELEQLCDWLVLIEGGRSRYQGPAAEFVDRTGGGLAVVPRARLATSTARPACSPTPATPSSRTTAGSSSATTTSPATTSPPRVNRAAHGAGIVLVELSPLRTSLEDRYLALVTTTDRKETRHDPHRPRRAAAPPAPPHHRRHRGGQRRVRRRRHARRVRRGQRRPAPPPPAAARRSPSSPPPAAAPRRSPSASSFVGFFVFVTFIALVATEFSGGTFRALLLRDPHRLRLIAGKLAGALIVAAGALASTELLSFGLSLALAPSKDIDTGAWFSLAGLGHGLGDYATALAGVTGWADLRHHARRDLPLGAAGARRRVRLGRSAREHRRRLLDDRLPGVPRPGPGGGHPGRHARDLAVPGPSSPASSTSASPPPPPPPSSPEGTSPHDHCTRYQPRRHRAHRL